MSENYIYRFICECKATLEKKERKKKFAVNVRQVEHKHFANDYILSEK